MTSWMVDPAYAAAIGAMGLAVLGVAVSRDATSPFTLAWSGGAALRVDVVDGLRPWMLVPLEAVVLLITLSLAWRSKRSWPAMAAVLQGIGLAALLARVSDGRVSSDMLEQISRTTSTLAILMLLSAMWLGLRRSRLLG